MDRDGPPLPDCGSDCGMKCGMEAAWQPDQLVSAARRAFCAGPLAVMDRPCSACMLRATGSCETRLHDSKCVVIATIAPFYHCCITPVGDSFISFDNQRLSPDIWTRPSPPLDPSKPPLPRGQQASRFAPRPWPQGELEGYHGLSCLMVTMARLQMAKSRLEQDQ